MSSEDPKTDIPPVVTNEIAPESPSVSSSPFPIEKKAYLFNQFYFDLLKKLKTHAKQNKEKSKEARNILRAIKNTYSSYETASIEYIELFRSSVSDTFWKAYYECPLETVNKFLLTEPAFDAYVYHQISVDMIAVCLNDPFILHHYLTIFAILLEDLTEEDATKAMSILKNLKSKDITSEFEGISNKEVVKWLSHLYKIYASQMATFFGSQFSDIENTSLGKMAKEIMEEVDLTNIQNTISDNGDILKAITDPNSGIGNLLGTVSQKMISKLASGEINQENLLEDAMKFATKLPSLMPGGMSAFGGMDFGKMTSMMQNMIGGVDNEEGVDMSSLMNMMQGMMGGGNNKAKRSMANNPSAAGMHSAAKTMASSARKSVQIKRLKEKIKKQTSKENNIPDQVE